MGTEPGVKLDDGKLRWDLLPQPTTEVFVQVFNPEPLEAMLRFVSTQERVDLMAAIRGMIAHRGFAPFLEQVATVLAYGAQKYCDNGWQTVEDPIARYGNACVRHLVASASGDCYDEESGIEHLAHAACNMLFLFHFLEERDY